MDLLPLQQPEIGWIINYGYLALFIGMIFEGPVITTLAAFAASFGYFDIAAVYLISFFGDWITDIFYYALGYWGRGRILERHGDKLGITKERLERIENVLKRHSAKGLAIIKLIPVVPTIGLIAAGAIRMPFKKFLLTVTVVIFGTSTAYTVIGYFFGHAYKSILQTINNIGIAIAISIAVGGLAYYLYRKMRIKLSRLLEAQTLEQQE